MAEKVTLDLTPVGADLAAPPASTAGASVFRREYYRLQPGAGYAQEHWLLRHPYGRDVLITKLREVRPDLQFMRYRTPVELEPFLEAMVDLLQMRDWPRPRTVAERVKFGVFLIRMALAQSMKRDLPDWREAFGG
jgi:hypothetical protein